MSDTSETIVIKLHPELDDAELARVIKELKAECRGLEKELLRVNAEKEKIDLRTRKGTEVKKRASEIDSRLKTVKSSISSNSEELARRKNLAASIATKKADTRAAGAKNSAKKNKNDAEKLKIEKEKIELAKLEEEGRAKRAADAIKAKEEADKRMADRAKARADAAEKKKADNEVRKAEAAKAKEEAKAKKQAEEDARKAEALKAREEAAAKKKADAEQARKDKADAVRDNRIKKQAADARRSRNIATARNRLNNQNTSNVMDAKIEKLESGSSFGDKLKNIKAKFGKFQSFIKKLQSLNPIRQGIKKLSTGLGKLGKRVKNILLNRIIRSAITALVNGMKEGLNNLYQWSKQKSGTFASAMDSIASSLALIKNSAGAAVAPVLEALVPIITKISNVFAQAAESVSRFFAIIGSTGKYYKAVRGTTEYASALGELKNQLLGFDELNILSQSSSGSSDTFTNLFEEVQLDAEGLSISKAIKDAINAGDWDGLGKLFATRLNKIVESVDIVDIAKNLASRLNSAFRTAASFIREVDVAIIGQKIGDFVYTSITSIDWSTIASTIISYVAKIISGTIELFKGIISGLLDGLKAVNWGSVLSSIKTSLVDGLKDILTAIKPVMDLIDEDWYGRIMSKLNAVHHTGQSTITESHLTAGGNTATGGGGRTFTITTSSSGKQLYDLEDIMKGFAGGGIPAQGSMFIAGEAGPEYVASINGRTQVYNEDQLAGSLASANTGVINTLTAVGNAIVTAINRKDTSISTNDVRNAVNNMNMRYGL